MNIKQTQPIKILDKSLLNDFENLRLEVTWEDLKEVFQWSPTQVTRIDDFLNKCMKGIWPTEKKKGEDFYSALLSVVSEPEGGCNLLQAMEKLQARQPKKKRPKKPAYSLWGRFLFSLKEALSSLDVEIASNVCEHKDDVELLKANIELLYKSGKQEYKLVFDQFMIVLIEDRIGIDDIKETLENNPPWSVIEDEAKGIVSELENMIQNLAIGIGDDEEVVAQVKILKTKGLELKSLVVDSAGQAGYIANPWEDQESFETYCSGLVKVLAEQDNGGAALSEFYEQMIDLVESIGVIHRLPRKQEQLQLFLQDIAKELRTQLASETPVDFIHVDKTPKEWFEWAFHQEGEELNDLSKALEKDFPVLSSFLGECEWGWLRFLDEKTADGLLQDSGSYEERTAETVPQESVPPTQQEHPGFIDNLVPNPNDVIVVETDALNEEVGFGDENLQIHSGEVDSLLSDAHPQSNLEPEIEVAIAEQGVEQPRDDQWVGRINVPNLDFVAQCLENDEAVKAYWVARFCRMGLSADLIGAFALGSQVGVGSVLPGELHSFYGKLVTEDFNSLYSKLLLFGAIAGVVIFDDPPSSEIPTLLTFVDTGIKYVDELVNLVKNDFLYQGAIRAEDLNVVLGKEDKAMEFSRLREMAIELLNRFKSSSLSYEPANIYLRQLYSEGGDLAEIHRAIERNDLSKLPFVRNIIKITTGEELVANAHKIGIKNIVRPFEGNARNQVIRRLNDTLSLGREWLSMHAHNESKHRQSKNEVNLSKLKKLLEMSADDLRSSGLSGLEKAAALALSNCLAKILANLNGTESRKIEPLNSILLAEVQIKLDDDFEVVEESRSCLLQVFSTKKETEVISAERIRNLVDRNEFLRAKYFVESSEQFSGINAYLLDEVERIKADLMTEVKTLNDLVEDAYLLGQLTIFGESDAEDRSALRSELTSRLAKIEKQLADPDSAIAWRIREILPRVQKIRSELEEINNKSQGKVKQEFAAIIEKLPDTASGREDGEYIATAFAEATAQGDSIAAFELLNRVKVAVHAGQPVPRASIGANQDLDQFVEQLPNYQNRLGKKSRLREEISLIQNKKSIEKIHYASLDKAHLEQVLSGLNAWTDLLLLNYGKSLNLIVERLETVASYLGLKVKQGKVTIKTPVADDFIWIQLTLEYPIDSSPVPLFGSSMGMLANVVISKNKMEVDQLYSFLTRNNLQHQAVFLLYLNEMGLTQREKYQRLFFKKKISVLIVDLCLAFYLSGIKNRLPILFNITLPFCFVQPYMMKGANVPSEIFVGREEEIESIKDPDGSCIIYGGRQLGKSALLRHFSNTFHEPNEEQYVAYVEIDSLGLEPQTHEQMREVFWRKVYRNLCRINFLKDRTLKGRRAETIEDEVIDEISKALLELQGKRVLYLLLDETDNFLDNDSSRNFPIVRRLRGMVASNNRQFKVIFAGLQSVQRYKNWKNHPFAQLGADIVIKPLSAEAAQRLILTPLSAIGFVFEKTGLILRILSQANYHPGLIQIFCHRLVENLYQKWGNVTSSSGQAKRLILSEDLQAIERNPSFKEEIKERFDWTLDLDDRYKVLTYAIVLEEDQTASRQEREFMQLARSWWPQVFSGMDQQALRAVLDEMVGLGVLVREDEHSVRAYRLRSPNLLRLLGTRAQIEDELMRITSLDKPRVLNSRNFHPKTSDSPHVFSPFTTEQEGQIATVQMPFTVTVITGSSALGLDAVHSRIKAIFEKEIDDEDWSALVPLPELSAIPENLISYIKKKLSPRRRSHHYLVADLSLFPNGLNLSLFFKELLARQQQVCTKDSRGHILFLMNSEVLWNWLAESEREELLTNNSFNHISLKRWSDGAITNAIDNVEELAGGKSNGEYIFSINSGWHFYVQGGLDLLINRNGSKINTVQLWEEMREEFDRQLATNQSDLLDRFGLELCDPLRDRMLRSILSWSNTDETLKITQELLDIWSEENPELSSNEKRLIEWLRILDILYVSRGGTGNQEMLIEKSAGILFKKCYLAER